MTDTRPDTGLRDAEIRGAVFDWLLDTYGAHVDIRVTDVDALFAGPLADLAALPARLHVLADELAADGWNVDGGVAADRLRALIPDTRSST